MKIPPVKHLNLLIVCLLAVAFFIATASFNLLTQTTDYVKWSSPDETANYFFAREFSLNGQLSFFDPAAVLGDNLVMPRSVRSDFGWIKPVSFLGIILSYGFIGSWLGIGIIPYLTPLFASLGIIIFYLLIKKIFSSERVGLLAAFLLASFPVYLYYTVRSMFHNILFIVFLLLAAYLFSLALKVSKEKYPWPGWLLIFSSGLLTGAAIITRSSELLWIIPGLLLIWFFCLRRLGITKLILFLAGIFLALLPVIYWNTILYSAPLYGGYNEMNRSLNDISKSGSDFLKSTLSGQFSYLKTFLGEIKRQIFYFGFNTSQSLAMFQTYVLKMFSFWVWGGFFGLIILIGQNIKRFQKKYLAYVLVWIILGLILVFYYGSWKFNDNPDPTHFTIGNSYTRYWLPIYLMLLPLVSLAVVRFSRALLFVSSETSGRIKKMLVTGLQGLIIFFFVFSGIMFTLYGSEEGLVYLYYNVRAEKVNTERVFAKTDPRGIIITRYYDKFFWPERRVIMGTLPNDEILKSAKKLVKHYPVYYYNFFLNEADVKYLNDRKLSPYNLQIKLIEKANSKFGLYQLEPKIGTTTELKIELKK